MTRQPAVLLLPKSWPRRVRSAVIRAISLARLVLIAGRGQAIPDNLSWVRIDQLQQEILLLKEEMRIKDSRMECLPAQRRPRYLPTARLEILELRAARGWSQVQTADRMLVTPATIASWMSRLDEQGPDALVQMRMPVNRFPDFVGYLVRRLKTLCRAMGKVRIAQVLARAGLHLSATTVARMLQTPRVPRPVAAAGERRLLSNRPNHVWHIDLTTVPTAWGFWVPWLPCSLPQRWPFCWWVGVVVDHFPRRIVGVAVFTQQPTSHAIRELLVRAIRLVGESPTHLITDHGTQFTDGGFRTWCQRRGIRQRFGAVGQYGSIAVVERLIRTIKAEGLRQGFCREVDLFVAWYNKHRPHSALQAAAPDELYFNRQPAVQAPPRVEPRRNWPRGSPCAAPHAAVAGRRGRRLELRVSFLAGRRHLPVVELKNAA